VRRIKLSPKFIKITLISVAVVLCLIAIVASLAYLKYSKSLKIQPEFKVPTFTLKPSEKIKLGDLIHAEALIDCPWGHFPEKVEFSPDEGMQSVGDPEIVRQKTQWGHTIWKIILSLQPYRTGEMKEERCVVVFSSDAENPTERRIAANIPSFKVLAVETGKDSVLDLASSVKYSKIEKKSTWVILGIASVLFIAAILLILILLRKRKAAVEGIRNIPPWVIALGLLEQLYSELESEKINPQFAVGSLTDIVRNYLEKRFDITVTAKTTFEFLRDLDKGNSPLDSEHRNFLRDFLTAADFVKFAKIPADDNMIKNAIDKARELVNSTIPENSDQAHSNSKGIQL